jgi:hypothetical protein
MAHTPGPWYGKKSAARGQGLVISERDGRNIAVTYDTRDTDLVAAAPELLKALDILVRAVDVKKLNPLVVFIAIEKALYAIEKATGERG